MKRTIVLNFRMFPFAEEVASGSRPKEGLSVSEYCRRAAWEDKLLNGLTEEQIEKLY